MYRGQVDAAGMAAIVELGVDRHELRVTPVPDGGGKVAVEVVLSEAQAAELAAGGAELTATDGAARRTAAAGTACSARTAARVGCRRSSPSRRRRSRRSPSCDIGTTVQGKAIDAVRVTKDPRRVRDGRRPTTVYVAAQHAREWITPEMVRRLLDHMPRRLRHGP